VSYPLFSIVYMKWNILHKKKKKNIFSLILDSSRNVKPFKYIWKVGEKRGLGKRDYVNHGDDILLVTSLVVRYLKRVSKIIDIVIA
jgi:hypothetical protein